MKKIVITIILLSVVFSSKSQSLTLLTFESYTFADKFITQEGYDGKVQDGFQYGGGFEIGLGEAMAVEIIYQRLDTRAYLQYPLTKDEGEVSVNYIMLGGTRYMPVNDKISGFGSVDLGLGILSAKDSNADNVEKFAWGLRLGVRIKTSEKVSLRLHAQLLSAVQAFGAGFAFGTGGGGASVSGFSTFYQFNLGGSLNFKIR